MLMPGILLGERYEIIEKVGAGGMSIVYKARDNRLQRYVAIKELREEFVKDQEFVMKFRREALAAASLSHPNIVGIYDVGSDHDIHYIVMEYIEGHTLKEVIEAEGPFDTKTVLNLGVQIVSALKHAHKKKIIHRDIKPQNILITNDHVLKVTDFGIAKAVDSSTIVATGNAIGSVHYFSPEQAKGKFVNETSDLYSCGIVLFELATKKLPFEADSHISIALKHINEEIPRPSSFNPAIPDNLEQLILKATSKSQADRYQNADEMLYDMQAILRNPNYVVKRNEVLDKTILLTPEETEIIRTKGRDFEEASKEESIQEDMPAESNSIYETEQDFAEDDEEDVSKFYKVLVSVGGVLATLALVVVISLACVLWLPSLGKAKTVSVPDIKGLTVEEATEKLKDSSLKIAVEEEPNSDYEDGIIFEQDPGVGEAVKKNSTITVKVAQNETDDEEEIKEIVLPDFIGEKSTDAMKSITELGLYVEIETREDDSAEPQTVVDQSPGAGVTLKTGDTVTIVVSTESQTDTVVVPNVKGLSIESARSSFESAGLRLGAQREEYSDNIAEGCIIDQGISYGTEVNQNTAVDVVVSIGPKEEEPSPEPSDNPEPSDSPEPNEVPEVSESTQSFTIYLPEGTEPKDSYHVKAVLTTANGSSVVYDSQVNASDFPVTISLTGSGTGLVDTFIDGGTPRQDQVTFN